MIDFHSHILPQIDDGSSSYEESLKMLEEARNAGFKTIISTSHYATNCFEAPEYKRKSLMEDLTTEDGIPKILLGSEIFLTYNIVDLIKDFKASTINGTPYVLIELPLRHEFINLKTVINNLKENDYIPIIAHPERYLYIQSNLNYLYDLNEMGALFQCNYGSILGKYGIKAKLIMKKMLKNGLVTFLGTDAHRQNSIYLEVPKAISKIKKYISQEELDEITTYNAEKVINGEDIW